MNIKNLLFLFLLACGLITWFFLAPSRTAEKTSDLEAILVGTNVGYPPFIFTDESGEPTGFDVAIAHEIGRRLGKKIILKDMAFDALLLALGNGSLDMVIGGISITPERKKTGLLIPYYGDHVTEIAAFAPTGTLLPAPNLTSYAAAGVTVCTQAGSIFEDILAAYPGISVKTLPDIADIFIEVTHGGTSIGILDIDSVRSLARQSDRLHVEKIPLSREHIIEGFGLGVTPHNQALRSAIEQTIAALKTEGVISALANQWFAQGA